MRNNPFVNVLQKKKTEIRDTISVSIWPDFKVSYNIDISKCGFRQRIRIAQQENVEIIRKRDFKSTLISAILNKRFLSDIYSLASDANQVFFMEGWGSDRCRGRVIVILYGDILKNIYGVFLSMNIFNI